MTSAAPLLVLSGLLFLGNGPLTHGASISPGGRAFIEKHCTDCHDDVTKEAGLDLTAFEFDPEDEANFATWVKVHDRVKAGEMPPRKKKDASGCGGGG